MNFRLTTVEIIRQQKGCSSSLRLQISALTCDECGAIPWDELQVYSQSICQSIFQIIFVYISCIYIHFKVHFLYQRKNKPSKQIAKKKFIYFNRITFDMKSCVHFPFLFLCSISIITNYKF